jgi:uncharacterized protein involved in response to NO
LGPELAQLLAAFGLVREPMLSLSGTAWVIAFIVFVVVYSPLLIRPRRQRTKGL